MAAPTSTLAQAPLTLEDPLGAPRFGTFQGSLDVVNLAALRGPWQPQPLERLAMHKRWLYGFVATHEVAALFAIVDLGYSSNAFAMAVDLQTGQVLADDGMLGPPRPLVRVNEHVGAGLDAEFRIVGAHLRAWRRFGDERYHARVRLGLPVPLRRPKLSLRADLLVAGAAPALTVIAPVDKTRVNITQKWAGLQAFGELEAGGRRYRLDGGIGGLDSTHGYLARRTAWRWAFVCSRLQDGTPFGINLVEGFNETRDDVNENAVWLGNRLFPVGRARFKWNHDDLLDRWHVTTTDGALDLHFKPIAQHREVRDLVFVRSRFSQPVGLWSGTVKVDGQVHTFENAPGVAEDQDVTW
jgi:hypothetical protein